MVVKFRKGIYRVIYVDLVDYDKLTDINADGKFSEDREKAIERLKKQEIKVIFSVDMFNDGLDIASLDLGESLHNAYIVFIL